MAVVNTQNREIFLKFVVDGPSCVSPGDVLRRTADLLEHDLRSDIVESLTGADRVAQLEFHPEALELLPDFVVNIQIFALLGNVSYQATRDLVYRDADGLVMVLDRSRDRQGDNQAIVERISSAMENNHRNFERFPIAMQFFDPANRETLSTSEMVSLYQSLDWTRPWVETQMGTEDGLLISFDHLCLEIVNRFQTASKLEPALDRFQHTPSFRIATKD